MGSGLWGANINMNKRTFIMGGVVLVSMVIGSTGLSFAQVRNANLATRSDAPMFCSRINQGAPAFNSRLDEQRKRLDDKRADREKKLSERRNERTEKREDKRDEGMERRDGQFAKLRARAQTDAQKQAVETFITTVTNAISIRKTAVDSAIAAFRSGVDLAISARKTAMDSAISVFQTSMKVALDKAKQDCAAGVDPATVKQTYRTSVESARKAFEESRKSIEKLHSSIEPLIKTRNDAIQKAIQDFRSTTEVARTELLKAFQSSVEPQS